MSRSTIRAEFLMLMAAMMCLLALYIDAMLPALQQIGEDLGALENNRYQMVISSVLVGMGIGQLFYGPLADAWGRKPAVYLGFLLVLIGTLMSSLSESFEWMLAGRVLQGLGAAGPRTMVITIIRDLYSGPDMARVVSLVMTIFIFSPVVAPLIGQAVLLFAGWREIFGFLGLVSLAIVLWFGLRQVETLNPEYRRPLSLKPILKGMQEVVSHPIALVYTLAAGLLMGAFVGFLTSIQGILQGIYQTGTLFPLYFALMALGVGFSSYINSRLVYRFELRRLVCFVLLMLGLLSFGEALAAGVLGVQISLLLYVFLMSLSTFCYGLLFGNINALAMEPFGKMAGLASGVVGALTMLIGVVFGSVVGLNFDNTIVPVFLGFGASALLSLLLIVLATPARKA